MAINLTPEQQARLDKESAKQANVIVALQNQKIALQDVVDDALLLDEAFKVYFDHFQNIVRQYEIEINQLTGDYYPDPINEADIVAVGALDSTNRAFPLVGDSDIRRINLFDGGGKSFRASNELSRSESLDELFNGLSSGFSSTTAPNGGGIGSLDENSTNITFTHTGPFGSYSVGDKLLMFSSTAIGLLSLTSVTENVISNTPPTPVVEYVCTFSWDIVPLASVNSVIQFSGFTSGQRSSKTFTTQAFMDGYVNSIELLTDGKKANLEAMNAAIDLNDDPTYLSTRAARKSSNQAIIAQCDAYINAGYLITSAGITTFQSQLNTRISAISGIVSTINGELSGGSFYDSRYLHSNNRANTGRGTLRIANHNTLVLSTIDEYIQQAQDSQDAVDNL